MSAMKANTGYSPVAKFLHWVIAACVIFLVPAGLIMANVPGLDTLYNLHRSIGATVLALMTARIGYRLVHGVPEPESSLTPFERLASQTAHIALYVLLVVIPIAGWAGASSYGAKIMVFGLFELPPIAAVDTTENKQVATQILQTHGYLALLATAIIAVHIGAALRHHFIKRDGVLQRMAP
ncbi:MAG: cytochrome b [Hyphomicrobiales bacterium]|nr:cytochrome b [Hyphomicrobiales bacterium]